ncbi:hypothetical protein EGW08_013259 [Elysia chlorotica]|uniref:Uncharacterized protein n=1 Tax=Elysia chlorotica TaxID=188477 RepID=A0A3S1BEL4_ELYCH|nr:hypothetical protein EGW08_013259 [Elysia chlorotica]
MLSAHHSSPTSDLSSKTTGGDSSSSMSKARASFKDVKARALGPKVKSKQRPPLADSGVAKTQSERSACVEDKATKAASRSEFHSECLGLRKLSFVGEPALLSAALQPARVLVPRLHPDATSPRLSGGKDGSAQVDTLNAPGIFSSRADHDGQPWIYTASLANGPMGDHSKTVGTGGQSPKKQNCKRFRSLRKDGMGSFSRRQLLHSKSEDVHSSRSDSIFPVHCYHSSDIRHNCDRAEANKVEYQIEVRPDFDQSELDPECEVQTNTYRPECDFLRTESHTSSAEVQGGAPCEIKEEDISTLVRSEFGNVSNFHDIKVEIETADPEMLSSTQSDVDTPYKYCNTESLKQLVSSDSAGGAAVEPDEQTAEIGDFGVQSSGATSPVLAEGADIHYSSESESDMLAEEAHTGPVGRAVGRRHREVTLFLVRHAQHFTTTEGEDEHVCTVCGRYKTNGLFKLAAHLKTHTGHSAAFP